MPQFPDDFESIAGLALVADSDDPKKDSLRQILEAARNLIPGCDTASITLVEGARTYTPVALDGRAERLDRAQYDEDSGPCLTAYRSGEVIHLEAIVSGPGRYEGFRASAANDGIVSSLSSPLRLGRRAGGALNCYSASEGFDDQSADTARLLAVQGAVLLQNANLLDRTRETLLEVNRALESRDLIGQAQGILMSSMKVGAEQALAVLREQSQHDKVKLRDLAEHVTQAGALDRSPRQSHPDNG